MNYAMHRRCLYAAALWLAVLIFLSGCSSHLMKATVVPVGSPPPQMPMVSRESSPFGVTGETYDRFPDNAFRDVRSSPLATLAVDVDTASYSNVRRFLTQNQFPPRDAVRIEELINYFNYDYPVATGDHPIAASIEAAAAPWNPSHRLVRVGVRAKEVQMGHRPSNLVFLVDVSGSMNAEDRLPLLQRGMRMLVDRLSESDTVSIVTYAGAAGVRLQPTNGAKKEEIARVIDDLSASGSTNGSAGIQTAYDLAVANFIRDGVNRVILMTDGDFNVGTTSMDALVKLIEYRAQSGVFLSVLGVGRGNLKDATMEKLADRGNGNYAYIDTLNEARKVLVEQMAGTLITVAKDVKLQVEFNPTQVKAYRLLGYENRVLAAADFANDRKDAGDMGAGHTVTAFFELVPHGAEVDTAGGDPLRFQRVADQSRLVVNGDTEKESLALRLRYKLPDGSTSRLMELPFVDTGKTFDRASSDFRFAAAVASFGMILRDSPFKGASTLDDVVAIARNSRGADRSGYREEFVNLAERARQIRRSPVLE